MVAAMHLPRRIILLGFLVLTTGLASASHTVNLSFDHLQLTGGALLGSGVIRTFDPANGRVMLQVGQYARSVSIEQLPAPLQQRLKLLVPYVPEKPAPPTAVAPVAAKPGAKEGPPAAVKDQAKTDTAAEPEAAEEPRPGVPDPRETARAAAKLFLSRNRFTPPADAANAKTISTYVLKEAVEPAVGAADRYLVTGHYEMKLPGRTGGSSVVGVYPFTVIVQLDPAGKPRDISIELH